MDMTCRHWRIGIKAFGVLLRLIQTRCVSTSKMLVLDEPEIHLHPEWQISFCRIIIELVANGVPIVVSSHSPYFIQGLRYFAAAKGVEKDVTYYMAEQNEDGLSTFNDVTDDLNKVFTLLAAPLHEIICVRSRDRERPLKHRFGSYGIGRHFFGSEQTVQPAVERYYGQYAQN